MLSDGQPDEKLVIGTGTLLHWAMAAWKEVSPDTRIHLVDIKEDSDYRFDLRELFDLLDKPADAGRTAFVAWGPQFLNFRRAELMGEIKARGLKMPPLVCRGAAVADTAVVGENCSIGPGSIVGHGSKLGYNSVVGAGCILGMGVQIGHNAWIADGVQVGNDCRIGANATLGRGVQLDDGTKIGRQSICDPPRKRGTNMPDRCYITASFPNGAVIIESAVASLSLNSSTKVD